jgi:hypothetical protein
MTRPRACAAWPAATRRGSTAEHRAAAFGSRPEIPGRGGAPRPGLAQKYDFSVPRRRTSRVAQWNEPPNGP